MGNFLGYPKNCKRPFTNIFYLLPIPNCMRFWSNSRSQKITFICSCIAQISRGWSQLITAVTFTLWIINLFSPTVGPLSDICLRFTKMYGILHEQDSSLQGYYLAHAVTHRVKYSHRDFIATLWSFHLLTQIILRQLNVIHSGEHLNWREDPSIKCGDSFWFMPQPLKLYFCLLSNNI